VFDLDGSEAVGVEAEKLGFWFYGPAIITCIATECFTVATVLSA
jgi:hypothetical protein